MEKVSAPFSTQQIFPWIEWDTHQETVVVNVSDRAEASVKHGNEIFKKVADLGKNQ